MCRIVLFFALAKSQCYQVILENVFLLTESIDSKDTCFYCKMLLRQYQNGIISSSTAIRLAKYFKWPVASFIYIGV